LFFMSDLPLEAPVRIITISFDSLILISVLFSVTVCSAGKVAYVRGVYVILVTVDLSPLARWASSALTPYSRLIGSSPGDPRQ
jgi:hypothetical protein